MTARSVKRSSPRATAPIRRCLPAVGMAAINLDIRGDRRRRARCHFPQAAMSIRPAPRWQLGSPGLPRFAPPGVWASTRIVAGNPRHPPGRLCSLAREGVRAGRVRLPEDRYLVSARPRTSGSSPGRESGRGQGGPANPVSGRGLRALADAAAEGSPIDLEPRHDGRAALELPVDAVDQLRQPFRVQERHGARHRFGGNAFRRPLPRQMQEARFDHPRHDLRALVRHAGRGRARRQRESQDRGPRTGRHSRSSRRRLSSMRSSIAAAASIRVRTGGMAIPTSSTR